MRDKYDPMGKPGRKHRRRQKLGRTACCIMCGTTDPTVLIQVERAFFEQHHVLGQAHVPDLKVTACRSCHARLSAAQVDDAVPLEPQPTLLERLIAILLALSSFLRELGDELLTWGTKGERFVSGLSDTYPDWRVYEWAT